MTKCRLKGSDGILLYVCCAAYQSKFNTAEV